MLLGAILLAELPSPWQLAGVALVLGGMALATGAPTRIRAALATRGSTA
jgi:drug/metabolite transporter (DMT)-like permease